MCLFVFVPFFFVKLPVSVNAFTETNIRHVVPMCEYKCVPFANLIKEKGSMQISRQDLRNIVKVLALFGHKTFSVARTGRLKYYHSFVKNHTNMPAGV